MSVIALDTTPRSHSTSCIVGEGFVAVRPGTLIEKGDEYLDTRSGRFVAFCLDCIGRPVPTDVVVRRIKPCSVLRF